MPRDARSPLEAAARALILATVLVPVVVLPGFYFPFTTVRAVFFRVLVELALAVVLYLLVRRNATFDFHRDFVFWALGAWVAANALSAVFGASPIRSIFGDHERMGGVWFWVHLLAYYVVLRTVLRPADWWRLFRAAVGVATVIALYGFTQYWFRPIGFPIGGIEVGATIGNPGLLAIYLLACIALCGVLATRPGARARIVYLALALVLLVALVLSGNRSSALALFIGSGAALIAYTAWSGSMRGWRVWLTAALFVSAAALPFIAGAEWARPVTARVQLLNKLSSGVDSTRVIQWRAAVDGIRDQPLLGVGPENYQVVWSRYYHPEMYRFLGESSWDRAHNAYLDAFATVGILGFLSLLAIWVALAWATIRAASRRPSEHAGRATEHAGATEAVALGFFVAYAFYLFFWFFDLNSTMLWVALAAFVSSRATGVPLIEIGAAKEKRWQSTVVLGLAAIALVSVLYVHGYKTLEMARTLDRARNPDRPFYLTLEDFESIFASPAPFTQQAFVMYATHIRALLPKFQEIRNDPSRADLFDRAFVLAIKEFERQGKQDPLNEKVLVQHARVLMLGAYYYGSPPLYESALAKLEHAVTLAPRRITTHLVLGSAYLNNRRTREALRVFERAYAIYPPHGQTQGYLAQAHAADGNTREAARWLKSALDFGYLPDRALLLKVARELAEAGDALEGAELVEKYLLRDNRMAFVWAPHTGRADFADYELAAFAAELYAQGGDSTSAADLSAAAAAICARSTPLVDLVKPRANSSARAPDCREPWRTTLAY